MIIMIIIMIFFFEGPLVQSCSPFEWKSIECHTANVRRTFPSSFFLLFKYPCRAKNVERTKDREQRKDGWKRDRRDRNDKKGNLGCQKSSHKGDRRRDRESLSLKTSYILFRHPIGRLNVFKFSLFYEYSLKDFYLTNAIQRLMTIIRCNTSF